MTVEVGDYVRVQAVKTPGHQRPAYYGKVKFVFNSDDQGRVSVIVEKKNSSIHVRSDCAEWAHHVSIISKGSK